MPPLFDRYINLAEDIDLAEALEQYSTFGKEEDIATLRKLGDQRYAPEKWTVKEVIQHVIDNERIQAYRALRFARNDKTTLPGYEENLLAANAKTAHRKVDELLEEFQVVRKSSIILFKSLNEEELLRTGITFNTEISVLALGFVLVGHHIHHYNVLKERYWGLVGY